MQGEGREKEAWVITDIGGREELEDTHSLIFDFQGDPAKTFGAVFDGHGGKGVAELAAKRFHQVFRRFLESGLSEKQALESTFLAVDKETEGIDSGCVAVAFLLSGQDLTFANAGDSELLLVSKSRHKVLTECHRLSNDTERMRIIESGGEIWGSYVTLQSGSGLQCTRSLGDRSFKQVGVIPNPFVGSTRLGPQSQWVIAACDGLWDVMLPQEVASIARKMTTARAVVEALHHEALAVRQTPDNLTVMAIGVMHKELASKRKGTSAGKIPGIPDKA